MRNKFDEQLHELNKEMIQMGNKIILSIKMAIEALISRDEKKAKSIISFLTIQSSTPLASFHCSTTKMYSQPHIIASPILESIRS